MVGTSNSYEGQKIRILRLLLISIRFDIPSFDSSANNSSGDSCTTRFSIRKNLYDITFGTAAPELLSHLFRVQESQMTPMLRCLVIAQLGLSGYQPVVSQCRKLFTQHVLANDRIASGDVRKAVFNVAAATAETPEDIEPLLRLQSKTELVEEKIEVLGALGSVSNSKVMLRVMDYCMGPEVSSANVVYYVRGLSVNFNMNEAIMKYLEV